jgi:hypothetical protein
MPSPKSMGSLELTSALPTERDGHESPLVRTGTTAVDRVQSRPVELPRRVKEVVWALMASRC